MCSGEEDRVFVVQNKNTRPVLELNCVKAHFHLVKVIPSGMDRYHSICYDPSRRLIIFSRTAGTIRAVSCDTEQKVWEVKKQHVGDVQWNPHGMAFSRELDTLFVADGLNSRIILLDSANGCLKRVVHLGPEVGVVVHVCFLGQATVVHHNAAEQREKVSQFSLQAECI